MQHPWGDPGSTLRYGRDDGGDWNLTESSLQTPNEPQQLPISIENHQSSYILQFKRLEYRPGPVPDTQFGEYIGNVILDCTFGHIQ